MGKKRRILRQLGRVLERLEAGLAPPPNIDWRHQAYRWRRSAHRSELQPILHPQLIELEDLLGMEQQKRELSRNTRQFLAGLPANNVLLWGSRGTGKSSLVKAVFNAHREQGLRLLEVEKQDLVDLPDIIELIRGRPEPFVMYCDDLSFEAEDPSFKSLKASLEGSLAAPPENLLVYATSNRRHLMPEFQRENRETQLVDGEIHPGETVEEKISLSERFGLWLSFYPFNQEQYLSIVHHWLSRFHAAAPDRQAIETEALRWALRRGSRSGRVAWQFARDWAGRFPGGSAQ